jgi:hypothetical protein
LRVGGISPDLLLIIVMKLAAALVPTMLFCAHVSASVAAESTDTLSGLPVLPHSTKLADPVQSYKYCGKNAQINVYFYTGSDDGNDDEDLVATAKAWYVKAMPHANVYDSPTGQVTMVTADGTSAVILSGSVISFVHFSPGLSAAEMQVFGNVPASRECHA